MQINVIVVLHKNVCININIQDLKKIHSYGLNQKILKALLLMLIKLLASKLIFSDNYINTFQKNVYYDGR